MNCYTTLLTAPSIHHISDGEAGDPGLHMSNEVESTWEELDNPDANGCGKTGVSTVADQDYWHYTEGIGEPLKCAFIWCHSTVRWRSQSAVSYLTRNVSWGSSSWQGEIDDGQMTVLFLAIHIWQSTSSLFSCCITACQRSTHQQNKLIKSIINYIYITFPI